MKFYRVSYNVEGGISGGFTWHTSRRDAEAAAAEHNENFDGEEPCEVEEVNIEPTKSGILRALERFAAHPDNG